MLYWNLDWNTSQDRKDAIHKHIITKLFVDKPKTFFFCSQNSSKQYQKYIKLPKFIIRCIRDTATFRFFTCTFRRKLSDIKGFALFQRCFSFTVCSTFSLSKSTFFSIAPAGDTVFHICLAELGKRHRKHANPKYSIQARFR